MRTRPDHAPDHRSPLFPAKGGLAITALLVIMSACRLTDHDEGEVNAGNITVGASGYEEIDPADLPRFAFDSTTLDMGRMVQGTQVTKQYHFINAGHGDLVISAVRGSCGCTVGKDWPKHPVAPGERGTIAVTFNSSGRSGRQEKTITVVANTRPPSNVLFLHGEVIAP